VGVTMETQCTVTDPSPCILQARSVVRRSHQPELYTGVSTDGGQFPGRPVTGRQSLQQVLNLYSAQPQTINAAHMSIWVYVQVSAVYR
jgi:hypothetical protein